MEKVGYYVCGLKPSIFEDMLEKLPRMPPNERSKLIDIRRIAAAGRRSHRELMKHAHPRQLNYCKTNKKRLPTFMCGDTPDATLSGSILFKEQCSESHLHHLDTMKVVFKLGAALLL